MLIINFFWNYYEKENGYQALTPAEDAMEIIRKWFENERNGDKDARKKAALDLKKFPCKN